MTDDSDEILDELRAALNVEPSPEFEARVRMATHASRRAGAVWIEPRRVWIWRIVASGAVAAAAIVAVLLRPGDVAAPSPVAAARPQPAAVGTAPARSIQQTATVVAKPLVPAVAWHKGCARVARIKPDLATAGAHYLEVIKLEPLAMEAHRTLVVLLSDTDGRAAARTHLAQACHRFPHHYPLAKLRAEFLSGDPDADADRALQDMLAETPDDAWAIGTAQGAGSFKLRWNGSAWTQVGRPKANDTLWCVTARDADDVWAAGYRMDLGAGVIRTVVEHWNGQAWTAEVTPNPGSNPALFGAAAGPDAP